VNEALARANVGLKDIDLLAVTQGPGLIGSLLVGFSYAKALSYVSNIPCVGVDHMAGHILSVFLKKISRPFLLSHWWFPGNKFYLPGRQLYKLQPPWQNP